MSPYITKLISIHQDIHYKINKYFAIPPQSYLKRNVQYQLLELLSKFDEYLLQRAETFNMNSFVQKKSITLYQSI